jgi:hypothetical protein
MTATGFPGIKLRSTRGIVWNFSEDRAKLGIYPRFSKTVVPQSGFPRVHGIRAYMQVHP